MLDLVQLGKDWVAFYENHYFYLYWIHVFICLYGWGKQTVEEYEADLKARSTDKIYVPTLVLGHVVGRFIAAFIPILNIWKAIFKFMPRIANDFLNLFSKWLDIPLVPAKKS